MKKITCLLIIFSTFVFSQTKNEDLGKHEKQIQNLISTISKVNKTLEQVKDINSAKSHLETLKKLQIEIQVLKAKQKALGNPPKEIQEKIVNQYAKSLFTEAQKLTEHLKRVSSDSEINELLGDIIKDFKP